MIKAILLDFIHKMYRSACVSMHMLIRETEREMAMER